MIPYKDDNPTELTPLVTVGIIALNALAWILVQGMGSTDAVASSVCRYGLIPAELTGGAPVEALKERAAGLHCVIATVPHWGRVLTSMFMHGGWFHLIGNMWFLWVFGNNIEDSMGHARFVVFYLLCGIIAAAAQTAVDPHSVVPMIGASGAISGVLGGYILLYPRVRVHTLITFGFFVTTVALPAYVMLGYWFLLQLLMGTVGTLSRMQGGVAFWAHVGGFAAGLLLVKLFAKEEFLARRQAPIVEARSWR